MHFCNFLFYAGYVLNMLLHLQQIEKGELKPEDDPGRAIFWKDARLPKKGEVVDEGLVEVCERILSILSYDN